MLAVKDLPQDERECLRRLQSDVSSLYTSLTSEYMDNWNAECRKKAYSECPTSVSKVEKAIADLNITNYQIVPVESDYYNWELQQRAFRVNMPSKEHMCKSVIMENTRFTHEYISDPYYSRYYCVITQYVKPVNTQKLLNFCRSLKNKEISKKYYNYRLAPSEVSLELTGFEKGGVAPLGMKQPIPIIIAESVTKLKPPVICLGAGHIDWKLCIPIDTLIEKTNCFIADLD